MEINRQIPEAVKRKLRQQAGFGCCICGYPFYEYHHIIEFAERPHHNPDDMMVLCPNHHHQATVRALDEGEQRLAKANPHNIERGFADGQLKILERAIAVQIATVLFVGVGFKLVVDGEPLLRLEEDEDGRLLISITLYDRDDNVLLVIEKNEWILGDPLPWDFEFGYRWLKLRRRHHDIALSIKARTRPIEIDGNFWRKGQHFSIGRDFLIFNQETRHLSFGYLGFVNLIFMVDTGSSGFSIVPDQEFGQGMIVSSSNPNERLERALEAYEKLSKERFSQHSE